jgi:glycosyltransferase involved in cell wall biosynthesis
MNTPVSVIILTYNEEVNIAACLATIQEWTDEIFIVDSFSTDGTLTIAQPYGCKIYQNAWTHYAGQRQWALANLPFSHDWILFLDADERLTPAVKGEINQVVRQELENPRKGGYYVSRRFFFLGKHLRWGDQQAGFKELRLCNRLYLSIGERAGHEVYISQKEVGELKEPMIHEDLKPLSAWIHRHNDYSSLNAGYLWSLEHGQATSSLQVNEGADKNLYRKELVRRKVWNRLPFGFRPLILFTINYVFRVGFLDGLAGFIYIFLHDFWFQLLIDAKIMELRTRGAKGQAVEGY